MIVCRIVGVPLDTNAQGDPANCLAVTPSTLFIALIIVSTCLTPIHMAPSLSDPLQCAILKDAFLLPHVKWTTIALVSFSLYFLVFGIFRAL